MNKGILIISLILISFSIKAEGYKIRVTWEGLSDTTLLLAHYYDSNLYVNDTTELDKNGQGVFEGDSLLSQGLYALYIGGNTFIDILIGDEQNIEIKTNNENTIDNLSIKGSEDSKNFAQYQKYLKQQTENKNQINEQLKNASEDEKEIYTQKLEDLDKEIEVYMNKIVSLPGNSMFKLFVTAANPVKMPAPSVSPDHPKYDSIAWFEGYFYRRDHFLDPLDLSDERILNTPFVKPKLETYFNKILIQSPDSIIPQALKIIREAESNQKNYQYVSQFLLNNSLSSKIMGMDKVFVAIADEVYLSGKASWADSTTMKKIAEEVFLTRPNLIGNKAPELVMQNINGEYVSLHELPASYTILIFYEYDCGHCKRDIPNLYKNIFLKYIDKNVDVYAVCMNDNKEKWEEFINNNEMTGWHNMWDPGHETLYRYKYNTRITPLIYLIDMDKKIIAKRIDQDNLSKLLDTLLN